MTGEEMEKQIRLNVLDSLISQSGKTLIPDVISNITNEIVIRIIELIGENKNG